MSLFLSYLAWDLGRLSHPIHQAPPGREHTTVVVSPALRAAHTGETRAGYHLDPLTLVLVDDQVHPQGV